ncbi:MAG: PTS sugar transporter subunit IIA [Alphaproteobacteria bacterium]|nr:PTS sugar transporter subunit IIA [Alphaproteobacteria bacterium]
MASPQIIFKPENIVPFFKASSKKQVLYELALRATQIGNVDIDVIFSALIAREKLGSTVIGEGIAMPHTKLPKIDDYLTIFMRLQEPVIFDEYDNAQVDLIFLLLVPDRGGAEHLRLLAHYHKLFSDADLCDRIRQARPNSKSILSILHSTDNDSPPLHHIA